MRSVLSIRAKYNLEERKEAVAAFNDKACHVQVLVKRIRFVANQADKEVAREDSSME